MLFFLTKKKIEMYFYNIKMLFFLTKKKLKFILYKIKILLNKDE